MYSPCPQVKVFPLQYLEVSIEGNQCTELNDSGCQIPIVSNRLFGWCAEGAVGRVNLHGFGQDHVVQAPLVNLTVKCVSLRVRVNVLICLRYRWYVL